MQLDMHYYGTYAMARAAGINSNASATIATAAQFVDDNTAQSHVTFGDGARIDKESTAHHPADIRNLEDHDQRQVWVPFHFIPGNIGETYTERLKCRTNSAIVQELRDHHLTLSDRPFALHLLGITAHVYADTFSHYGFSGVSSRGNKVKNSSFRFHQDVKEFNDEVRELAPDMLSYVTDKFTGFFSNRGDHGGLLTNIKSSAAEYLSGALGHGSVATLPDRPYLVWSFDYERKDAVTGIRSIRNNPETFLAGCRALYEMFCQFVDMKQIYDNGDRREFKDIESQVREVLNVQANKPGRIAAWQDAAVSGSIFGVIGETIPEYDGNSWNERWDELNESDDYHDALSQDIWRFYQAASLHRNYVLRDLLPKHDLIVN